MFGSDDYQLLDFGSGRRLERFGQVILDRPCPAAEPFEPANTGLWSSADARFDGRDAEAGQWTFRRELPQRWTVAHGSLCFELKRTDFGHLGLFPEQAENWDWIANVLPLSHTERGERLKVLNLFAYTGGSTLAAAAAGAEVVHVDAAKNIVAWARRNAELSGLADAQIRWITEDAMKFVKRELKRGARYDAVILDPPSYGHGPRGEVWRLSKHLPRLLSLCRQLTSERLQFMLLTCHTPGYDPEHLSDIVAEHFFTAPVGWMKAEPLLIRSADGRELPSGVVVRWKRRSMNDER
jgi:23S rRNA (cytosine1962-C5)-methyltransferase